METVPDVQAAPAADTPTQSLATGHDQAPVVTDEGNQGVSDQGSGQAQAQPETTEQQAVSLEEFQRIQEELQKERSIVQQIRDMAEQQRRQEEEREYRTALRSRIQNDVVKRIQNMEADDDVASVIDEFVGGVLNEANTTYQSQVSAYYQQVEQALWAATKPGFADSLISEHKLPASMKANLLAFDDRNAMELAAAQMADALKSVQQQVQQQTVHQQVQQVRESGSHAMAGMQGGSPPMEAIKPGTASQLTPTLRHILGLR